MASTGRYSECCKFIRDEFHLTNEANIYEIVDKITTAYQELMEAQVQQAVIEEPVAETAKDKPLKKEKKRGRPRKKSSDN